MFGGTRTTMFGGTRTTTFSGSCTAADLASNKPLPVDKQQPQVLE